MPPKLLATSLPARLLNVFAIPGEVFEEVKASTPSAANWLTPALLFIAIGWMGAWLISSQPAIKQQLTEITDKAMDAQIEKMHMSKEQAEQARRFGGISTGITPYVSPVFVAFVSPFWWGLIFWLVGAKILKGNFGYLKAVEVAGLSNMIGVLGAAVRILLVIITGNFFASPSLALLVKEFEPRNPLHSLLAVVNVITIWFLIVRSIGLARLSGVALGKALVWVFGLWLAWTGLMLGLAAAAQSLVGR